MMFYGFMRHHYNTCTYFMLNVEYTILKANQCLVGSLCSVINNLQTLGIIRPPPDTKPKERQNIVPANVTLPRLLPTTYFPGCTPTTHTPQYTSTALFNVDIANSYKLPFN